MIKINIDEECETCPMIELETERTDISGYDEPDYYINTHHCKHEKFCDAVKKNWEKHHKEKTV